MSVNQVDRRKAFWLGVVVAVAFPIFAFGSLVVVGNPFQSHIGKSLPGPILLLYIATLVGSPFWVPCVAGFLGAYFWRHIETRPHDRASYLYGSLVLASVALVLTGAWGILLLVLFLSVNSLACGIEWGRKFWNSRTARQLVGDFSTHEEDA